LRIEVGIQITVPDSNQSRAACLDTALRPGPVQRHVVENVLPQEHTELAPSEQLATTLEAHGQVHLAHVDLGQSVVSLASVVDLRCEAEMHTEVVAAFVP